MRLADRSILMEKRYFMSSAFGKTVLHVLCIAGGNPSIQYAV